MLMLMNCYCCGGDGDGDGGVVVDLISDPFLYFIKELLLLMF
jgi:hypothetical protein